MSDDAEVREDIIRQIREKLDANPSMLAVFVRSDKGVWSAWITHPDDRETYGAVLHGLTEHLGYAREAATEEPPPPVKQGNGEVM